MSYIQEIAAKREQKVAGLHLDLPLATWEGNVIVRFGVLERDVAEGFAKRQRDLNADSDYILSAVKEIYVKDPGQEISGERYDEDEAFVRLEHENGAPIVFTEHFPALFGVEGMTKPREVLLWAVGNNRSAVGALGIAVSTWMSNTDRDVARELAGE